MSMTAADFRSLRASLGLPGSWLYGHLGVNERTVRKWEQGERSIPAGVATEMRSLAQELREEVARLVALHSEHGGTLTAPRWASEIPAGPHADKPLEWWRVCLGRVIEEVPTLSLEWPE